MFDFFKKRQPAPPLCPGNPGTDAEARVAYSNGVRTATERLDLLELAGGALHDRGFVLQRDNLCLRHVESGFILQPRFLRADMMDTDSVQTSTTIQVNHPQLIPDGLFEYQHACDKTATAAISKGFDLWAQVDFHTLLQSLKAEAVPSIQMEFPAERGGLTRRAVLGPIMHYQRRPPKDSPACSQPNNESRNDESEDDENGDHPFCPCCLLTRSMDAFERLLRGDGYLGLRMFACRNEDGQTEADCRVNGEDYEPGAEALRAYAETWPEAGYEFRKQYVVLQTMPPQG